MGRVSSDVSVASALGKNETGASKALAETDLLLDEKEPPAISVVYASLCLAPIVTETPLGALLLFCAILVRFCAASGVRLHSDQGILNFENLHLHVVASRDAYVERRRQSTLLQGSMRDFTRGEAFKRLWRHVRRRR